MLNLINFRIPGELNPQLIKKDFGDNAIMRANNIKRIVTTVQSFLGNNNVKFSISNKVDPQTIANTKDEDQLELIIQGLLGVAVECPKREEYISTITSLPENCMRQLMLLIDAVINAKDENNSISSQDLSKYTEEISALYVLFTILFCYIIYLYTFIEMHIILN